MNYEIQNGYVISPKNGQIIVEQKNIYISNGKITFQKKNQTAGRIIDATNKIILPALTNAHHHIYSTLAKGVPCDVPFHNFLGNLKKLWWTLDHSLNKNDMILSTAIAMKNAIENGVTTIFDHHISGYTQNALSDIAKVFDNYGISGTVAFEISDRNGENFFEESLMENIRFAKLQKEKKIQGMIGLHASFTLGDKSLQKIADTTENFPVHVHIAEDEFDAIQCQKKYGKSLIERFDDFGLLRKNSLLIHCSNLTENDLNTLQNRDVFIVQTVDSNMNNGLNIGNISQFISSKIKTTVGTDGMHSSTMKALKNSMIFTKYLNKNCDIGYSEMEALFLNNYKLKNAFGLQTGIFEGEVADIAIFDYEPATPFNTEQFLGHLIFGVSESRCQYVIKNNEILLDNYQITKNIYKDYFANATEISKKMFARFAKNKGRY